MNDNETTDPSQETVPGLQPRVRRLLSSRRSRWITATAVVVAATGISAGFAASGSTTTPSNSTATAAQVSGGPTGGTGSGRRSIQRSFWTGRGRS